MSTGFEDNDLVDEFDTTGVTPESLDSGGNMVNAEGKGMFLVMDVVPYSEEGKLKNIRFDCQCIAFKPEDQVDKMMFHRIYREAWKDKDDHTQGTQPISEGSRDMLLRFARGLGLVDPADLGKKIAINWALAKGRLFCCAIEKEEGKDKNGKKTANYRIPFGRVYPHDHEEVADYPKSAEHIALSGSAGTDDVV